MSYSKDFCIALANDKTRSGNFADLDWGPAKEVDFPPWFRFIVDERVWTTKLNDEALWDITINYDPNARFDYFTNVQVVHDGTLLLIHEAFEKIMQRLILGETYFLPMGEPQKGDHIYYTVGNFVVLDEHGSQVAPPGKPWAQERTTVLLPIKYNKGREGSAKKEDVVCLQW